MNLFVKSWVEAALQSTFPENIYFLNFLLQIVNRRSGYPDTTKSTIISPDFLVWKFCGKTQFPHSFEKITGLS